MRAHELEAAHERAERLRAAGATAEPVEMGDRWVVEVNTPWHEEPVHVVDDDDAAFLIDEMEARAA